MTYSRDPWAPQISTPVTPWNTRRSATSCSNARPTTIRACGSRTRPGPGANSWPRPRCGRRYCAPGHASTLVPTPTGLPYRRLHVGILLENVPGVPVPAVRCRDGGCDDRRHQPHAPWRRTGLGHPRCRLRRDCPRRRRRCAARRPGDGCRRECGRGVGAVADLPPPTPGQSPAWTRPPGTRTRCWRCWSPPARPARPRP